VTVSGAGETLCSGFDSLQFFISFSSLVPNQKKRKSKRERATTWIHEFVLKFLISKTNNYNKENVITSPSILRRCRYDSKEAGAVPNCSLLTFLVLVRYRFGSAPFRFDMLFVASPLPENVAVRGLGLRFYLPPLSMI
jgi:hypothetical protein